MPRYLFPELMGVPAEETPEGLVALGGDLSVENLLEAYRRGIFPWPVSLPEGGSTGEGAHPHTWFSPVRRGVLELGALHVPRSLRRARRKAEFSFTLDERFDEVILACARGPRPAPPGAPPGTPPGFQAGSQGDTQASTQTGTWITEPMIRAYRELHRAGFAHSVEAWSAEKELVGGLYGVDVDGAFAGESMFHLRSNASKLALLFLAEHLRSRGLDWIDIQMLTPHLEALGAREISRDGFLARLAATRARGLRLF